MYISSSLKHALIHHTTAVSVFIYHIVTIYLNFTVCHHNIYSFFVLQSNPVRFAPLILSPKLPANMPTFTSVLIVLQGPLPTYSQINLHWLRRKHQLALHKFRSNKCMIYGRAGFVILQAKLQYGVGQNRKKASMGESMVSSLHEKLYLQLLCITTCPLAINPSECLQGKGLSLPSSIGLVNT